MVNQHRLHKHSPGRPAQKLAPRHSRLDMVEQYFCLLADELILPPVFAHIPWTPSNSPVRPASIWLWFKAMCRPAARLLLSIPVIDAAGQGPQRPTHAAVYPTAGTDGGYHQFGTKLALSDQCRSRLPRLRQREMAAGQQVWAQDS